MEPHIKFGISNIVVKTRQSVSKKVMETKNSMAYCTSPTGLAIPPFVRLAHRYIDPGGYASLAHKSSDYPKVWTHALIITLPGNKFFKAQSKRPSISWCCGCLPATRCRGWLSDCITAFTLYLSLTRLPRSQLLHGSHPSRGSGDFGNIIALIVTTNFYFKPHLSEYSYKSQFAAPKTFPWFTPSVSSLQV